jgi:hypothetical protein
LLIIRRVGNTFTANPAPDGNQTISYLQLKFTDYEDMIVLDNRTIFNDLIYNPATAERQSRLRLSAATSTDWNGTLNAQGFILNQNNYYNPNNISEHIVNVFEGINGVKSNGLIRNFKYIDFVKYQSNAYVIQSIDIAIIHDTNSI